ncbi:hypothetical protein CsSME_00022446 [Camellia sinensis var. sinensis]
MCPAGAIAATVVCPLDVIKTRLQVYGLPKLPHSGPRGNIIITSLQNIIQTEGLKGMYRGLSPTLVALLPNWAVSITFLKLFLERQLTGTSFIIDREPLRLQNFFFLIFLLLKCRTDFSYFLTPSIFYWFSFLDNAFSLHMCDHCG